MHRASTYLPICFKCAPLHANAYLKAKKSFRSHWYLFFIVTLRYSFANKRPYGQDCWCTNEQLSKENSSYISIACEWNHTVRSNHKPRRCTCRQCRRFQTDPSHTTFLRSNESSDKQRANSFTCLDKHRIMEKATVLTIPIGVKSGKNAENNKNFLLILLCPIQQFEKNVGSATKNCYRGINEFILSINKCKHFLVYSSISFGFFEIPRLVLNSMKTTSHF